MSESPAVTTVDIVSAETRRDPFALYDALRAQTPVLHDPTSGLWMLLDYESVHRALHEPETFSSRAAVRGGRPLDWLIFFDPPRHTKLRALVLRAFTPRVVAGLEPRIRELAATLLDAVIERGEMDVAADFSVPLPLMVIAEMLGIPEEERGRVYEIAEKLLVGPRVAPGRMREIADAMRAMDRYATPLVEERSQRPGHDLISVLAGGEQQGVYTRDEVLQNIAFLVVAGHETTINLICNGLLAFIRHPDQWDRLRGDSERLAGPATEECLRYDPPVKSIERIAVSDVELRGKTIKALDRVRWFIASANRDPERFSDPDSFDIGRTPNPHVGFGHGIHLCLGATVARVEGQEVFRALAERFERFTLETDPLRWAPAAHLRSLKALEVSW